MANLRLAQAIEQSKLGDPLAIDAAIELEVDKEKRKIDLEFQKKVRTIIYFCNYYYLQIGMKYIKKKITFIVLVNCFKKIT